MHIHRRLTKIYLKLNLTHRIGYCGAFVSISLILDTLNKRLVNSSMIKI